MESERARRACYRRDHQKTYAGKKRGRKLKRSSKTFTPGNVENNETLVELLTHARYPLLKSPGDWTDSQEKRMQILFNLYPRMKKAYCLVDKLRSIFKSKITKEEARVKLHEMV